jgi:outer membrane protein assembly factor BamC
MRILLLVFVMILSSCGLIQDRSSEYIKATPSTDIAIPEGLSDRHIQSQYPIPLINNKRPLATDYELPKPPNATAALDDAPYTIDQVNNQLWLRLYLAPGKVWPLVDAFWQEYEIETIQENISKGFVVTDILNDTSKLSEALFSDSKQRFSLDNIYFQASLSQGIRRNTSEIKVRVIDSLGESPANIWQKTSVDIERDKAVLELMGSFITSDALQNRYSMLANSIGGESRIQLLQNSSGQNYLLMALSFQRAWNELEKAFVASEVVIADKDISQKTFYISYINESDISQWYFSDENISGKKLERNFSLTLIEEDNGTITVEIEQLNKSLEPSLKNELLDLIFEHIS